MSNEKGMSNFELVFDVKYASIEDPPPYRAYRIVALSNEEMACQVAEAMLREEVDAGDFLDKVVSVKKTSDPPRLSSWDAERTWARALKKLEIDPNGVEYILSGTKKVGFAC